MGQLLGFGHCLVRLDGLCDCEIRAATRRTRMRNCRHSTRYPYAWHFCQSASVEVARNVLLYLSRSTYLLCVYKYIHTYVPHVCNTNERRYLYIHAGLYLYIYIYIYMYIYVYMYICIHVFVYVPYLHHPTNDTS